MEDRLRGSVLDKWITVRMQTYLFAVQHLDGSLPDICHCCTYVKLGCQMIDDGYRLDNRGSQEA